MQYSQFCERFRKWRKENSKEVTISLERKPGEVMEVELAGDTMDLLCDRVVTGELLTVYLFCDRRTKIDHGRRTIIDQEKPK